MGRPVKNKSNEAPFYKNFSAHFRDELARLDLLIKRRVTTLRIKLATMPKDAAGHPMYISHGEVDWLLETVRTVKETHAETEKIDKDLGLLNGQISGKIKESVKRGIFLPLVRLSELFGLSAFEIQTIVICLASELDRKYDKLYAYLQDDVTRKKPSIDLVLDLLCTTEEEKWQARSYFISQGALFRAGILQNIDDPQSPSGSSGLAQFLKLDQRIFAYLRGNNNIDGRLIDFVTIVRPSPLKEHFIDAPLKDKVMYFIESHFSKKNSSRKKLVLHFCGPYGVGKHELAMGICGYLNCALLNVNMEIIGIEDIYREDLLKLIFREGLLCEASVYLANVDMILREDDKAKALMKKLTGAINEYGWLTFLSGEKPWVAKGIFEQAHFHAVEISVPDFPVRKAAWEYALKPFTTKDHMSWAEQLAAGFHFTPGQIFDAAGFALQESLGSAKKSVTLSDIFSACRTQSNRKLSEMGLKIIPRYEWNDLVLPKERTGQLKEICNQMKNNCRVFGEWGFGRKIAHGRGLSVLFAGPSGTGKTMAAEVIAHELQLDLYKIDLSGVVSKYIGETEKNLAKVFQEAQTSNAILFFDEADALFGKRTEVSDAHDRYANIETSYLLQKMDEYEGMVILATNLRENMDEAFTRRIRFIVEFPFPDEASRNRIWRTHFPKEAPLGDDIDYESLSKRLQIAGGNIKNIVLNAAFLAADNSGAIGMEHVLHGAKREFEKIGKLWTEDVSHKQQGPKG